MTMMSPRREFLRMAINNTSSSYDYGHLPLILNGHLRPSENPESQAHGTLPDFPLHQSCDPMSNYAQLNGSGMDCDGCCSPLNSAGAADNCNGNDGIISAQTSQSLQEGNYVHSFSSTSCHPRPNAISANQQHLPFFCQPAGIHLSHHPPFFSYAPYFSPIYVTPHAIPQFFNTSAFPQPPHGANVYLDPSE